MDSSCSAFMILSPDRMSWLSRSFIAVESLFPPFPYRARRFTKWLYGWAFTAIPRIGVVIGIRYLREDLRLLYDTLAIKGPVLKGPSLESSHG
ncbi:MAG: hypothetical protein ABIE47_08480, partial [Pseudomonadota bacterium]